MYVKVNTIYRLYHTYSVTLHPDYRLPDCRHAGLTLGLQVVYVKVNIIYRLQAVYIKVNIIYRLYHTHSVTLDPDYRLPDDRHAGLTLGL